MSEKVEEELAYLRRVVEDLSEETARQGREIDRLSRRVALLLERAAEAEQAETGGTVIAGERPPHY